MAYVTCVTPIGCHILVSKLSMVSQFPLLDRLTELNVIVSFVLNNSLTSRLGIILPIHHGSRPP